MAKINWKKLFFNNLYQTEITKEFVLENKDYFSNQELEILFKRINLTDEEIPLNHKKTKKINNWLYFILENKLLSKDDLDKISLRKDLIKVLNFYKDEETIRYLLPKIEGYNLWQYLHLENVSYEFIEEFKNKISWISLLVTRKDITEEFIIKYISYFEGYNSAFYVISSIPNLSEKFIWEHLNQLDILQLCIHQKLSEEFIIRFIKNKANPLIWGEICRCQKLSEEFILDNKNYVYWPYISRFQKLSEGFILDNKNLINWDEISRYQKFSEEFIWENRNLVNWEHISIFQRLSENFIRKACILIHWSYLPYTQNLSDEFLNTYIDHPEFENYLKIRNTEIETKNLKEKLPYAYQHELNEEILSKEKLTIKEYSKYLLDKNYFNTNNIFMKLIEYFKKII